MIVPIDALEIYLKGIRHLKIGMVSGGFDPIHIGHIRYIRESAKKCDFLIAVINGDSFLMRKKGFIFMKSRERAEIVDSIKGVDAAVIFDSKLDTVDEPLSFLKPSIFFKGGDRDSRANIPEWGTCAIYNITIVTNIGGEKIQSSSELVAKKNE